MIYHDLSWFILNVWLFIHLYWENFGFPIWIFKCFPHQFSPLNVYPNNDLISMSNPRSWVHNFCGSAMVNLHGSMIYLWFIYDLSMIYLWFIYDLSMIYLWFIYDLSMIYHDLSWFILNVWLFILGKLWETIFWSTRIWIFKRFPYFSPSIFTLKCLPK